MHFYKGSACKIASLLPLKQYVLDFLSRHYPLKFAQKMVDTIPAFVHFAKELKEFPQAIINGF